VLTDFYSWNEFVLTRVGVNPLFRIGNEVGVTFESQR